MNQSEQAYYDKQALDGFFDGVRAAAAEGIASEGWLRERFPDKEWHRHPRSDGRTDLCDGTPSDCAEKVRL